MNSSLDTTPESESSIRLRQAVPNTSNEAMYYDALKRIAKDYKPSHRMGNAATGLSPSEELEYAYDNIQAEAASAIKGKRRPK